MCLKQALSKRVFCVKYKKESQAGLKDLNRNSEIAEAPESARIALRITNQNVNATCVMPHIKLFSLRGREFMQ